MLALSVLAGLAAVLAAARWMGQQAATDRKTVMVAVRDLPLGQAINATMLQPVPWPADAVPAGSFSEPTKLEGRVVRTTIFKGEPVLLPKLAPEGTKAGLDSVIKPGHRAITIKVNEVLGVAGFLAPGSYVDLMLNAKDATGAPVSRVVLERVLVLAVAQEAQRADETRPKVVDAVTLEVTPQQAEKIDLARNIGTLSLTLRNQVDTDATVTSGMRAQDLLSGAPSRPASGAARPAAPPADAPARRAEPAVEVIRGLQRAN